MRFIKSLSVLVLMAFSLMAVNAQAADFVEKKVVLQASDKAGQTMVLNVAGNLIKHYGKDQVKIEIVAFGPGLGLLVDNKKNKNTNRVTSLAGEGVTFSACGNTLKKMTKKNKGKTPKLHAKSVVVDAGAVRIIDLVGEGYVLLKP
jgi:hypothetical protein